MLNSKLALKSIFLWSELVRILVSGQSRGEEVRGLYIYGDYRGGGLVLVDTGKVKYNKEKKDFDIETMMDEILAVGTMKTILMGLAMVMWMVVI